MAMDLLKELIEKLDKKTYIAVIRCVAQNNKRMKLPGFSSLERAPRGLILNTARTDKRFSDALLDACVEVILDGIDVDYSKSLLENKERVTCDRWLGLAAAFLKKSHDQDVEVLATIISEYKVEKSEPIREPAKESEKQEKREEKFRDKYLKAHAEVEKLTDMLNEAQGDYEKLLLENDELKKIILVLNEDKEELLQTLKNKEQELIQLKSTETTIKVSDDHTQCVQVPGNTLRVLAPNCQDVLGKYAGRISIEFEDIAERTKEELMQLYDQVWVLPNAVSFATSRKLSRWRKEGEERIVWFLNAAELLLKAETMI